MISLPSTFINQEIVPVQVGTVKKAAKNGISVGGVGYGTLASMRQSQYAALQSTLKQP